MAADGGGKAIRLSPDTEVFIVITQMIHAQPELEKMWTRRLMEGRGGTYNR